MYMIINIFGYKVHCFDKNCIDEIIGGIAILLGLIATFMQFNKTISTMNVESFSIYSLVLVAISEMLFIIQGFMKKSHTIMLTRIISFVGVMGYILIWYKTK